MPPSPWVVRFLNGAAPGGRVLDVACGTGRHTRLALQRGLAVTAIDRDTSRLGELSQREDVEVITADLEDGSAFPLVGRKFDAVIMTNYLWRSILPALFATVAPDGLLICEVGEAEQALVRLLPELPLMWVEFKVGQMGVFVVERHDLVAQHARIRQLADVRGAVAAKPAHADEESSADLF